MPTGYKTVPQPVLQPYRYGLLAAATVVTHSDADMHWQLGVQYDADACANGGLWDMRCSDAGFTVTLTRTANANEFQVTFSPTAGPYEASVDGGAFQPFSNGGTFVETTNPFTIVVRETTGLHRVATISGINPGSPQGTVFTGTSSTSAGNPPKTADGLTTIFGEPFAVYAGVNCKAPGLTDASGSAARRLQAVEQRLVEQYVWENLLTVPTAQLATGSTDAVPLKQGIGALETALGHTYGGIGVIHATAWASTYAADRIQIVKDGPVLRTNLDTAWAFGRGYGTSSPTDVTPPADSGELWMYATGAVTVHRSEIMVPADERSGALNLGTNDVFLIAERNYVVTLDCPLWAVHITMSGEDPPSA